MGLPRAGGSADEPAAQALAKCKYSCYGRGKSETRKRRVWLPTSTPPGACDMYGEGSPPRCFAIAIVPGGRPSVKSRRCPMSCYTRHFAREWRGMTALSEPALTEASGPAFSMAPPPGARVANAATLLCPLLAQGVSGASQTGR